MIHGVLGRFANIRAVLLALALSWGLMGQASALPRLSPALRYVLSETQSGRALVTELSSRHRATSLDDLFVRLKRSETQSLGDVQEFNRRIEILERKYAESKAGDRTSEGLGFSGSERALLDSLSLELLAFRRSETSIRIEFISPALPDFSLFQVRQRFLSQSFAPDMDPAWYAARHQRLARVLLEGELSRLPDQGLADSLLRSFESFQFVDYKDGLAKLIPALKLGKSLDSLNVFSLYDQPTASAFRNYLDARSLMATHSGPIDFDLINALHRQLMKHGIEGLRVSDLGKVRSCRVCGNATTPEYSISPSGLAEIQANPYLRFEGRGSVGVNHTGIIWYPEVSRANSELLNRVARVDSALASEIRALVPTSLSRQDFEILNRRFIEALVLDRIQAFNQARRAIGDLDSPEKIDDFVALVAQFQRDFVSIHPFPNGNGRTSRTLAFGLLEAEGLFAPRLRSPDADILVSADEWIREFKDGMAASRRLHSDAIARLQFRLNPLHSPEVLAPHRPLKVRIHRRVEGSGNLEPEASLVNVDPKQYPAYLKLRLDQANPFSLAANPVQYLDELAKVDKDFVDFVRKHTIEYIHRKSGLEEIRLSLVDLDFREVFGRPFAPEPGRWRWKMDNWYSEELVWRGLVDVSRVKSEPEILQMFREITGHTVSMRLGRVASTHEGYRLGALREFDRYNSDLLNGKLPEMARHHSEALERYADSYGYSTSRLETVGKAFAMGAMVLGKYGEHQAYSHLAKSRLNVGIRRASKDVFLGRLKQLYPDFSYKYGRQQEVMGIGAADPDSVMVVKDLNADGTVRTSYVRNVEIPNEVWVVKGDFNPDQGAPPVERLIRTAGLF
jgi:hypothetical protein